MANQEEAIEHSIDQLIALNMDDSDEVELTHRPANNVTLTDAERREKISRRLTFGDYKTPAAAKAALNELNVQLQDIEARAHETCFLMALQIYPDRERRRRLVYGYLDRLRLPAR